MSLEANGFEWLRGLVPKSQLAELRQTCEELPSTRVRNLLSRSKVVRSVAHDWRRQLEEKLQTPLRAIRGILFDKVPLANWKVPWHQDRFLAVEQKVELPGYTGWTEKDGVPHVEPPTAVLEEMIALRVHLDD